MHLCGKQFHTLLQYLQVQEYSSFSVIFSMQADRKKLLEIREYLLKPGACEFCVLCKGTNSPYF